MIAAKRFFALVIVMAATQARAIAWVEEFDSFDASRWHKANGWTNGAPFDNGWRADHADVSGGLLTLTLDDTPCSTDPAQCSGKDYASGEVRTNAPVGYGRVEGRFKAAAESGVITSLFTYTGPYDGNPHDEIDIEIKGSDTSKMQVNYFVNGVGGHEHLVDLGFDAALGFHTYAFEWTADAIRWFVDDTLVHAVSAATLPSTAGRVMMNLWPVDASASAWAGDFNYSGTPVTAQYDWVSYDSDITSTLPIPGTALLLLSGLAFCRRRTFRRSVND